MNSELSRKEGRRGRNRHRLQRNVVRCAGSFASRCGQRSLGTIPNRRIFRQSVVRSIRRWAAARPRFHRLDSKARRIVSLWELSVVATATG